MANYCIIACQVLEEEVRRFSEVSEHDIDFRFPEQDLHNVPEDLKARLQKEIDSAEGYDAILLGYGLCSNGITGLVATSCPLVVPRAHDCITIYLGSKERYKNYFDENPGTYWYTPGWIGTTTQPGIERYEKTLKQYVEKYGEDNAKFLMEMEQNWFREYSNAAYTDLGSPDAEKHKSFTKECATWLNWNYDELEGDDGLIKRFVAGDWDEETFLVVPTNKAIVPTHDETIIRAEPIA